jgi:hypothetical protein
MSFRFVVARYNENIDWLNDVSDNTIILNKGEPLNIRNEIILKNVGRESESYLQYIIMNYENLPDIVVFTQANISDHRGENNYIHLLIMLKEAHQYGKSIPIITHESYSNNEVWWDPEFNYHNIDFLYQFDVNLGINNPMLKKYYDENIKWYLQENYLNNRHITFRRWFTENINSLYPETIHLYACGLFAVRKELILKHSKEYYKNLIKQLNHHINPIEGHFFERSWFYIFE